MSETIVSILLVVIILVLLCIVFYLYQMETMGATKRTQATSSTTTGLASASGQWFTKRIDSNSATILCEITATPTTAQTQCLATFALPEAASAFTANDEIVLLSKTGQSANGTNVSSVNADSISLANDTINVSFFSNDTSVHTLTFWVFICKADAA